MHLAPASKNPWPTWLWSVMGKVYLVVWSPKKHYLLHCLNELHPRFFISSACHCHQCCGIVPSWWDPLHLGCSLLWAHPPLWNNLTLLLPSNSNYTKSTLKWNISLKGETLEKKNVLVLPWASKRKLSCAFNMQAREWLWHLQILQT